MEFWGRRGEYSWRRRPLYIVGDTSNRYASRSLHLGGTTVAGAVVPLPQSTTIVASRHRETRAEGEEVHALGRYYRPVGGTIADKR